MSLSAALKSSPVSPWAPGRHGQLKVIAVHVKAVRRMRRQSGIVVRLFDQVFRSAALVVKPDHEVDRIFHVGHEYSVSVLAGFEQLVLPAFLPLHFLARFLVAESYKAVGLAPALRLVMEFALPAGIRLL